MRVMSLQAACRAQSLVGPLVLVEPTIADVSGWPREARGGGEPAGGGGVLASLLL
jgi:hypothetical protein